MRKSGKWRNCKESTLAEEKHMYCLLKIDANNEMYPAKMSKASYDLLVDGYKQLGELLDIFKELHQYRDALIDLETWCRNADNSSAYLLHNIKTAERMSQSILSAFKNYLEHLKNYIKTTYGEESAISLLYKNKREEARNNSDEFTFVYELRNYAQHYGNVVHKFNRVGHCLKPSSDKTKLLQYTEWNTREKEYISARPDGVDLLEAFEKAYDALGMVHQPLVQYILDNTDAGANLRMFRRWMDGTFERKDAKYYSLAEVTRTDGKEATMDNYRNVVPGLNFEALVIDWDTIYEITDSLTERK